MNSGVPSCNVSSCEVLSTHQQAAMEWSPNLSNIWFYFGLVALWAYFDFWYPRIYSIIDQYLIQKPMDWTKFKGKWAIITGCTDGVGKFLCKELARKDINLVMISRNQSKLDKMADFIKFVYGVKVRTIKVDFIEDQEEDYCKRVEDGIKDLDVEILFNVAGQSPLSLPYTYIDGAKSQRFFKCVITNLNNILSIVLPKLVKKKSGLVVNIGSLVSYHPVPLMAVYSGTRAYIRLLTECMAHEYKDSGVQFQLLTPGLLATKLAGVPFEITFRVPSVPLPDFYVRTALTYIGTASETCGYWLQDFERGFINFSYAVLPYWMNQMFEYEDTLKYYKFMEDNKYDYDNFDRKEFCPKMKTL